MIPAFQDDIPVNTLSLKPGVTIWYAGIPAIIRSIFGSREFSCARPLVNVTFNKEAFAIPVFSEAELKTINGFKALKKQIEWISGRYLIKRMAQHIFFKTVPLDHITLSYLDEGAPFLTHAPDVPISLSHSNDYTAVACCTDRHRTIGIDIEKIRKKPDHYFLKTAFTQNEILNMEDDAAWIFKHWTIKEAYLKYIKKGFNESLHKVEVINNDILHNRMKVDVEVYSAFIDDYVLSLVSD